MGEGRWRDGWRVATPVVLVLAGVVFVASASTARGTDLRTEGTGDLAELVQHESTRNAQAAARSAQLRAEIDRLTATAATRDSDLAKLLAGQQPLAIAAGLTPQTGPALTVSLDDAPRSAGIPPGAAPDDLVVHQQDVQAVVNALWAGGAEAMMIQDQRVISTSAVRCVGNTLRLQGRVYSPPYRVTAIGDVSRMRKALQASPEVSIYRQYVSAYGLGYDVQTSSQASMPAFAGSLDLPHVTVGAGG